MIGQTVAHYRVLEKLGGGGMGVVYRAEDIRLGRHVALKFLSPGLTRDETGRARFVQEAQAASALDHPHICTVYEIDETPDGQLFIAMAYYAGETLKARIEQGRLPIAEAIELASQAAEGLAKAHTHGLVHRDVKPANLMLTPDGVVKILDFGLAKSLEGTVLTQTGIACGTVAYMSPEQARGDAVDRRTDLWALGVVLYEMLTARLPFHAETVPPLIHAILNRTPEPLHLLCPEVPPGLARVVGRALVKSVAGRYQRAEEMLSDLRALQRKPGSGVDTMASRHLPSIAVLPFSDMSPQRDQDYLCEGITEELTNALAGLRGLHVVARSSAFQFKGQALDMAEVGMRLNVDTVLEGSVRKAGTRLRVTAQLINVSDGYHLWSERYDRDLDDVFAVQDEIARAIASTLRVKLLGGQDTPLVKRHTDDLEAYNLYLQGRYYWSRRYAGFLPKAVECFEQASARDPSFALPHAGLADGYSVLGIYGVLPFESTMTKAKAAADRALALDDTLAEAHQARAFVRWFFDWDWLDAEREYRRALDITPHAGLAHAQFGTLLAFLGRFDEAVAEVRQGVALEPVSTLVGFYAGSVFYLARRYERGLDECRRSLELDPNFVLALWVQGLLLTQLGAHAEAIDAAERAVALSKRQTFFLAHLGTTYAAAGRHDQARAVLEDLIQRGRGTYVTPLHVADVFTALGDTEQALTWLERAAEDRGGFVTRIATAPIYDALRADPRFAAIVSRMGLSEAARAR